MQAIVTKFVGATNSRGSRIIARCQAKWITVSYDHALNADGNHAAAAQQLAESLGWTGDAYGRLVGGGMPDGSGNCYVLTGRTTTEAM